MAAACGADEATTRPDGLVLLLIDAEADEYMAQATANDPSHTTYVSSMVAPEAAHGAGDVILVGGTVIYFGKNTYQLTISFKIDSISAHEVRGLAGELLASKHFISVDRDQARQTILNLGDGTEKAPWHQLRFAPDSITLWAGWHIPFERWQEYRWTTLKRLMPLIKSFPIQVVRSLSSQSTTLVPNDRMKERSKIQEIALMTAIVQRILPKALDRGSGYSVFMDESGSQSVEWWIGPSPEPEHGNVSFTSTRIAMNSGQDLFDNLVAHTKESDELLQAFHTHFMPVFIKV